MRRLQSELRALLGLAWPLILAFSGNQLLGVVDTAMVGRLGAAELAGVALGSGVYFTITVMGMGFVLGVDPLISQAVGAGEGRRVRAAVRTGVRVALGVSVPLVGLLLLSTLALPLFGIDEPTSAAASALILGRTPGLVPLLLLMAFRSLLQARSITRPFLVGSVVANVVNLVFNGLLIYGDDSLAWVGLPAVGLPALGVLGSGIASTLATFAQLAVMLLALRTIRPLEGGGDERVSVPAVLRVGGPIAATYLAEVGAFTVAAILAARLGSHAAAGHQVAITLASLTFTVTMGFASATSVRVGKAVGRGDSAGARLAGFAGFAASTAFMLFAAGVFIGFAGPLAGLLSDRAEVLAAAIPLIHIAAFFQVFDGAQAVGAGALRGVGETKFIQYANLVGYYAVGLPLAVFLAFPAKLAERGLWWGLSAGLFVVAAALVYKFERISRGVLARIT